jgi:DNA-binding NtrC family response regulator
MSMHMAEYDILLIGDGANVLKTIGWVLDYRGCAVKMTASPEAALEALVKKNYDLVIAKLTTADRESFEILQRASRLNPEVKVMVVAGNNDVIYLLDAYEFEVDDYILMPVSPAELWWRVIHCLEDREVIDLQPVPDSASSHLLSADGTIYDHGESEESLARRPGGGADRGQPGPLPRMGPKICSSEAAGMAAS